MKNAAKTQGGADATRTSDEPLPHDRDETPQAPVENAQHRENRKPIDQARADVESGIRDTERIGTPNDVPASDEAAGPKR